MSSYSSPHSSSVIQALFVTVLWSSSWVLIKFGLKDLSPLVFAGLRYSMAFLILLGLTSREDLRSLRSLNRVRLIELLALGAVMYFLTQGAQFLSLNYFPAVLPALFLNLTPVVVGLISFVALGEKPNRAQVIGIGLCLCGAALYLVPKLSSDIDFTWHLAIPFVGMLANAVGLILGRAINRREHLRPRLVTLVSMGVGSCLLLGTGAAIERFPSLTWTQWGLVLWLAGVNTAFAFTLWNRTLRSLSTIEASVINNTMMVQIAVLAWIFLGESLSGTEIAGLGIATIGALLVQIRRK